MIVIRKPMYLFAMLAFASTLFAADPFVGTWKLNPAKSKYSAGAPHPKDATIVIEEQGDNYLFVKYTVPANGGGWTGPRGCWRHV